MKDLTPKEINISDYCSSKVVEYLIMLLKIAAAAGFAY
jgi:hypothetical protein